MSFVALSQQAHSSLSFTPVLNYKHADKSPLVPVVVPELTALLQSHTLCFGKIGEHYSLFALVGTTQHGSAYVTPDGNWASAYVPASLRKGPFALLRAEGRDDLVLCISEEGLTSSPDAEPLFDGEGEMTQATKTHFEIVKLFHGASKATDSAVSALEEAGVIKPWETALNDGKQIAKANGLYCIDEKALNSLSAEKYQLLQGAPMAIAYAQLFSMRNKRVLEVLIRQKVTNDSADFDVDTLFGKADDTLKFNL